MATRRLILLRHGEAEPAAAGFGAGADRDRRLTAGGRQDVQATATALTALARPDLVLVSPAARARETWEIVRAVWGLPTPPESTVDAIYGGHLPRLIAAMTQAADPEAGVLMLVGHNPLISQLSSVLTGAAVGLGTANAVILDANDPGVSWAELLSAAGGAPGWQLHRHIRPPGH